MSNTKIFQRQKKKLNLKYFRLRDLDLFSACFCVILMISTNFLINLASRVKTLIEVPKNSVHFVRKTVRLSEEFRLLASCERSDRNHINIIFFYFIKKLNIYVPKHVRNILEIRTESTFIKNAHNCLLKVWLIEVYAVRRIQLRVYVYNNERFFWW